MPFLYIQNTFEHFLSASPLFWHTQPNQTSTCTHCRMQLQVFTVDLVWWIHGRTDPGWTMGDTRLQFSSNCSYFPCMNEQLVQLLWRPECRPFLRGWMCLQDRSRAASPSWSPAVTAMTRTSASAELMASDKCVIGELSGPEVHGSSFYERETLQECYYILSDGLH